MAINQRRVAAGAAVSAGPWASSSRRRAAAAGGLWAPSSSRGLPWKRCSASLPGQRASCRPRWMAAAVMGQPSSARASAAATATAPLWRCSSPRSPSWGPPAEGGGSGSTQRSGQPCRWACCSSTAAASGAWGPLTARPPACSTPAFSVAIRPRVGPRASVWSRPMLAKASTDRRGCTVVASRRPPRPTSSTASSTWASAKATKAAAVTSSNGVRSWRRARGCSSCSRRRSSASAINPPGRRMRSHQLSRWGEV